MTAIPVHRNVYGVEMDAGKAIHSSDIEKKTYGRLDDRLAELEDAVQTQKAACGRTFIESIIDSKESVDRFLTQTDAEYHRHFEDGRRLLENIKILNDQNERDRQQANETRLRELKRMVADEVEQSNAHLDHLWAELEVLRDSQQPFMLNEALSAQKSNLTKIVQAKNATLTNFQNELDRLHKYYYDSSAKQETDIIYLCERTTKRLDLLREFFRDKVNALEHILQSKRSEEREHAAAIWTECYIENDEHFKRQTRSISEKKEVVAARLDRLKNLLEEKTRATKLRMETEMEQFQYEMRAFKSRVTLNVEKIRYGYKILKRKKIENVLIQSYEKHKISKINKTIFNLRRKMNEFMKQSQADVEKKSSNIAKISSSIKFNVNHIQVRRRINMDQFVKVWKMHEKYASNMYEKICGAQRVLYEEILGWNWKHLTFDRFDFSKFAMPNSKNISKVEKSDFNVGFDLGALCDAGGFIVENKLMEIMKPYCKLNQAIITIENIFRALAVDDMATMWSLKMHFERFSQCPNCSKACSPETTIEREDSDYRSNEMEHDFPLHHNIQTLIDNDRRHSQFNGENVGSKLGKPCDRHMPYVKTKYVKQILRNFIQSRCNEKETISQTKDNSAQSFRNEFISNEQIDNHWNKYLVITDESNKRIWSTFEFGLNQMLVMLKRRKQLADECELLRRQNFELKHCLRNFSENQK